jgi:DNA-binding response OmpR family regulator
MPQQGAIAPPADRNKYGVPLDEHRCGILSISAFAKDHEALRRILSDPEWQITCADSCHQAIGRLCRNRPAVIICERHLPDGTWRDLLSHIADLIDPPALVVTSEGPDDHLLSEVLSLGGYHVLSKPFVADEVKRVLATARRHTPVPVG